MKTPRSAMAAFLEQSEPEMFALLRDLVRIQSFSRNKAGCDRMADRIARALITTEISCQRVPRAETGDHLVARSAACDRAGRQILLVGHTDTVFPEDSPFNDYTEDGPHGFGPGVVDMKGGLVVGIFAIKALGHAGLLKKIPVAFVFNSDEEIGSPSSTQLILDEAKRSAFAFVFEAAGSNGEVVTGRKGNLSAQIHVHGRAGHAAFAGPDKASAILELARKTIALEELNDPSRQVTVNVGTVSGGIGPNTVPDYAAAQVDARFASPEDQEAVGRRMEEIASACSVPGTRAEMSVRSRRLPMPATEANRHLFSMVRDTAAVLGMTVGEEFRQGVSDANTVAGAGIPVIDGLGPAGGRDHSVEEFLVKASLVPRTLLTACAMVRGWRDWGCEI